MSKQKRQQAEMFWFRHPRRDEHYQWWWGYRKVRINKVSEAEKQQYLNKMRSRGD